MMAWARNWMGGWWAALVLAGVAAEGPAAEKTGLSVGAPPEDHSPAAERATFEVLEGFEVALFADESDGVANPLALRWDERGRLWCLQTTSYPQVEPGPAPDDRVVILEDRDGDGRADQRTVFAEGLSQPMGFDLAPPDPRCVAGGSAVYVGEGTKLWRLLDTDGDDRADVKEVVFSGFGTGDTHQNLNSFVWSPDGSLVMHQGLHCYSKVDTAWGTKQLYGAGFWRYWPRSARLEPYPTGMPLNGWGTVFSDELQPYMIAGAAGMFWARPLEVSTAEAPDVVTSGHGIPHFLLSRQQLPYSGQMVKTEGLRKFCGIDMPDAAPWPVAMRGELVAGGFFENAVYRYRLEPDEEFPSGKKAVEQPVLIKSRSVAFRPVDVKFGPDGALYIADWYNPIIGHYQASFRHPDRDKVHGRIWRMTARGEAEPEVQAAVTGATRWERYQGWRLLGGKTLDEALATAETALDRLRVHEHFEVPDEAAVAAVLGSTVVWERAHAVHALGNWAQRLEAASVLAKLELAAQDEAPLVRLEAVVAAAKVPHAEAVRVALRVMERPMDSYLDRALWLTVQATRGLWQPGVDEPGEGWSVLRLPPEQLAFLIERADGEAILAAARRVLVGGEAVEGATRRALAAALVRSGRTEDREVVLSRSGDDPMLLTLLADAVEEGPRGSIPAAAMAVLQGALAAGGEPAVAAIRLAAAWKLNLKRQIEALLAETGKGDPAVEELRAAAVRMVARGDRDRCERLALDPEEAVAVRAAAVETLAVTDPARAGRVVAGVAAALPTAEALQLCLAPVLVRPLALAALVERWRAEPCDADVAKLALRVLTSTGTQAAELSAVLYGILGSSGGIPAYDPSWVEALVAEVRAEGTVAAGEVVFNSLTSNCRACHQLGGEGGIIGPELDAVGRGVPMELLVEAIVWPNRQIKEGYLSTTLTLKDGQLVQGYKVSENAAEVRVKDLLTGEERRLPRSQVVTQQEAGSLMPEGLVMGMTRTELRDLVAYLATLGLE